MIDLSEHFTFHSFKLEFGILVKLSNLKKTLKYKNTYRSGTANSKSFVSKDFLQNKWKYELMIGK